MCQVKFVNPLSFINILYNNYIYTYILGAYLIHIVKKWN
jgi:hypothetical protein